MVTTLFSNPSNLPQVGGVAWRCVWYYDPPDYRKGSIGHNHATDPTRSVAFV
jgi:hypothetical protein